MWQSPRTKKKYIEKRIHTQRTTNIKKTTQKVYVANYLYHMHVYKIAIQKSPREPKLKKNWTTFEHTSKFQIYFLHTWVFTSAVAGCNICCVFVSLCGHMCRSIHRTCSQYLRRTQANWKKKGIKNWVCKRFWYDKP